ncbi:MAG TPA: glycosyltransferase [Paludibacteraceae bacterium]|nr:glycosyltransferase [Paludibacteraceae bacterium]
MTSIKLFILSNIDSVHTQRWVMALSQRGCTLFLFGINGVNLDFYTKLNNVTVQNYTYKHRANTLFSIILRRFESLRLYRLVRSKIKEFQPDIVHAHYAVDYGTLGVLSRFHPFVLSVWGSDVYGAVDFSWLQQQALRYKLSKADYILSTSEAMALETHKYTDKKIGVIPFGVDMELFRPLVKKNETGQFVVGTVKSLEPIYGIDVLIRTFKLVVEANPDKPLRLEIIGKGSQEKSLKILAQNLGIADKVCFIGALPNNQLPTCYNRFDVAVNLSNKESFGVVAIEAMACGCPVVVSDAEGFKEVVEDGRTGIVVPKQNPAAAAVAIQKFIDNPLLRDEFGVAGIRRVKRYYDWQNNVCDMMRFYSNII